MLMLSFGGNLLFVGVTGLAELIQKGRDLNEKFSLRSFLFPVLPFESRLSTVALKIKIPLARELFICRGDWISYADPKGEGIQKKSSHFVRFYFQFSLLKAGFQRSH